MSADSPSPRPTESDGCSRRRFLERGAATAGGLAVIGAGTNRLAPDLSPVGNAQAIAPAVIVGGAVAGAGVNWAVREGFEYLDGDDPPEGLTATALENRVYETARTRKSTNASTFVDNKNILDGIQHAAYGDGKIEAIEALNDQQTQQEVIDAAVDGVDEYATTVKRNFLKGWNESVRENSNLENALEEHSNTSRKSVFEWTTNWDSGMTMEIYNTGETTHELPNGEEFELVEMGDVGDPDEDNDTYTPVSSTNDWSAIDIVVDGETVRYLDFRDWNGTWDEIESTFDSVRDGITLWAEEVYDEVQSGDLDPEELLTPRELAEMTAEDEDFNQAISDLMALNVSVDLEREATITFGDQEMTLHGQLAVSDDFSISAGDTIDPEAEPESFYFTYDVSEGRGEWTAYDDNTGVDGGKLYFTQEPFPETAYEITTTAGELAIAEEDDFTPLDDEGNEIDDWTEPTEWVVDLSDQLDDAITDVEEIEFIATISETQYETVQLGDSFTVESIEDSDGNEVDSMTVESGEAQDDTNYMTEDEWEDQRKRQEELIDKYEESLEDDDGVDDIGLGLPTFGGFTPDGDLIGIAVIGVVVLSVVGIVTDLVPFLGD